MIRLDKRTHTIFTIILLIWAVAVAYLCFGHFEQEMEHHWSIFGIPDDKIVHFCMFFPFPFIAWLAFDKMTKKFWHSVFFVILTFIAGCVLAAATEIGQSFTDYRTGDIADFRTDAFAMGICSLIVFILDISKQAKHDEE